MNERPVTRRARFLVAEFIVIVMGVLVALGVDQFMAERRDRTDELEYADRLMTDLAADTTMFAWFRGILGVKAATLQELLVDPAGFARADDPVATMSAASYSTFIGLPPIDAATFEELQSSGRIGLIRRSGLRSELTLHYSRYKRITTILDQLFGSYRHLLFASLPGVLQYEARLDTLTVDETALREGLEMLIRDPALTAVVNAELAYTASMRFYLDEADQRSRQLLRSLEAEYGS